MYIIGLGLEVTPLNFFIKKHYYDMNLDELNIAEINILRSMENSEKLVSSCQRQLDNEEYTSNKEKELLIHTIEDNNYQINSSKEVVKLIQS